MIGQCAKSLWTSERATVGPNLPPDLPDLASYVSCLTAGLTP